MSLQKKLVHKSEQPKRSNYKIHYLTDVFVFSGHL